MSRRILFVAFVVDDSEVSHLRDELGAIVAEVSSSEVFDLGSSPYVSPAEMYARYGSVRKIAARTFKGGQVSFDFV